MSDTENDIYATATPFGMVDAVFEADGSGVLLQGPPDAVAHIEFVMSQASNAFGMTMTTDNVEPSDYFNFCQPKGSGIVIMQPAEVFLDPNLRAAEGGEVLDAANNPIMIRVTSGGKQMGTLTPDEFRKAAQAPKTMFLPEVIKRFNEWKEEQGEPERAESFLPGAKRMDSAVIDAVSNNWHSVTMEAMKRKDDAALRFIIKDATEAADIGEKMDPPNPKSGQYRDEAHYASMELMRRRKGGKRVMDGTCDDGDEGEDFDAEAEFDAIPCDEDAKMDATEEGAYLGQEKKAIEASAALLRYLREFIRSEFESAKNPMHDGFVGKFGFTSDRVINKQQAQAMLTKLIDVAISRKGGEADITRKQYESLLDFQHDARVIEEYFEKRMHRGSGRSQLRTKEMKARYPEIDNPDDYPEYAKRGGRVMDGIVLDGDFKGHPFRGNQHSAGSRESGTAVGASIKAKHAEKKGDAKAAKSAHRGAHHAHMAAMEGATGKARKYHKTMAKFHGQRAGVRMDSVDEEGDKPGIDAAVTALEVTLDVLQTNEPINRAEGNDEQADLEAKSAEEVKAALEMLVTDGVAEAAAIRGQLAGATGALAKLALAKSISAARTAPTVVQRVAMRGPGGKAYTMLAAKYMVENFMGASTAAVIVQVKNSDTGAVLGERLVPSGAKAAITRAEKDLTQEAIRSDLNYEVRYISGKRIGNLDAARFLKDHGVELDPSDPPLVPESIKPGLLYDIPTGTGETFRGAQYGGLKDFGSQGLNVDLRASFNHDESNSIMNFTLEELTEMVGLGRIRPAGSADPEPAARGQATRSEGSKALSDIKAFLPAMQYRAMRDGMAGEEGQFFIDKAIEMAALIAGMPVTYAQDGKGSDAVVSLHYFKGGGDWWITEKDKEGGVDQAYGLADIFGDGGEMGYISIRELVQNGVELDLHFDPRTLAAVKGSSEKAEPDPIPEPDDGRLSDAQAVVVKVVAELGGSLGQWDRSGPEISGHWERTMADVNGVEVRISVSGGGVIQVNGDPFTPVEREMIVNAETLTKALLAAAPVRDTAPPLPEPAIPPGPRMDSRSVDMAFLEQVAGGQHPQMLEPELADQIEAALTRFPDDADVQAMGERAIIAYSNGLMAATG